MVESLVNALVHFGCTKFTRTTGGKVFLKDEQNRVVAVVVLYDDGTWTRNDKWE